MGLHLWYLEVLFIFSLLTLPLFRAVRRRASRGVSAWVLAIPKQGGLIFLLAIPLAIVEILVNLQPKGIGGRDFGGWSLAPYLLFLIYGYLIASDEEVRTAIERQSKGALVLAVMASVAGFLLIQHKYSSYSVPLSILRAFNSWFWLVAIIGSAGRFLRSGSRLLAYANEAVMPFYVLHQTVIVIIGYAIASWEASIMAKYLLLATASFTLIMALYELVVRRIGLLRFLFGMKENSVVPVAPPAGDRIGQT
jgi:glucan biosynthesis protein C